MSMTLPAVMGFFSCLTFLLAEVSASSSMFTSVRDALIAFLLPFAVLGSGTGSAAAARAPGTAAERPCMSTAIRQRIMVLQVCLWADVLTHGA